MINNLGKLGLFKNFRPTNFSLLRRSITNARGYLNPRVLGLVAGTSLAMLTGFKKMQNNQKVKFQDISTLNFNDHYTGLFQGLPIISLEDLIGLADGENFKDEKIAILVNPKVYNTTFLSELARSLKVLSHDHSDVKILLVNEDEIPEEIATKLNTVLGRSHSGANLADLSADNTLFLLKSAYDDEFKGVTFSKYFNNKELVGSFFNKIRVINDENQPKLLNFISNSMSDEQMYFVAILPEQEPAKEAQELPQTDGEDQEPAGDPKAASEGQSSTEIRRGLRHLRDLRMNSFISNEFQYGLAVCKNTSTVFGEYQAGDILVIQRNTLTKRIPPQKKLKIFPTKLIENDKILITKISPKLAPSLTAENWSAVPYLKQISDIIFETNLYMPSSVLEYKDLNYLVKITFDRNRMNGKDMARMRKSIRDLRAAMARKYPKLEQRTVFTLNPTKVKETNGYWFLNIQDVKRSDINTMYNF